MIYDIITSVICLGIVAAVLPKLIKSNFEPIYESRHASLKEEIALSIKAEHDYNKTIAHLEKQIHEVQLAIEQEEAEMRKKNRLTS